MKCLECGREFKPTGHGKAPKYCSNACRQKAYKARRKAGLAAKPTPSSKPQAGQSERPDLSRDEFKRMMDESLEDVLRRNRDRLSQALDDPDTPANALAAISRQLIAVVERLDRLEGGDPLLGGLEGSDTDDDDGDHDGSGEPERAAAGRETV